MRKENEKRGQNKIISIGVMIILGLIFMNVSGCAAGFLGIGNSASWKEEVLLHDGSKIIVERWQKHGGRHELGQNPGISDQSITFTIPDIDKTIKWKDKYSVEIGSCNFNLVSLHILKNTPYIITTACGCLSYNKWERPNPPYIIFKFENDEWKRMNLAELPMEFKNINITIDTVNDEEELVKQAFVSAEMVQKLNESLKQPEYKAIIRTPIKIWCEEEIYDGHGSWYGVDWFTSKPSYEACIKFCEREKITAQYCPCDRLFKSKTKEK